MKRLERRLRALEHGVEPMIMPPFIVGLTLENWPRRLKRGERLVVDYVDGGLIHWAYRVTSDPQDYGIQQGAEGGYITECLRRRAAGQPSWPLPWEGAGAPNIVCRLPETLKRPARTHTRQNILWRPPRWRE